MGDNKKSVDLSSFFLFENVADFDPNIDVYDHHHSAVADPDDAESCCSNNGETDTQFKDDAKARLLLHSGSFSSTHLNDYYGSSSSRRDHREENVSNEEDDVDKSWTRCRTVGEEEWEGLFSEVSSTANSHCSRSGSRSRKCRILGGGSSKRSSKKKMNEQEKNKLFWENCLASSSFSKLCSNFLFH